MEIIAAGAAKTPRFYLWLQANNTESVPNGWNHPGPDEGLLQSVQSGVFPFI